jgi:hypothetical protein
MKKSYNYIRKLLCGALVLIGVACQPTLIAEFEDRPVVEGYLFAGEPVSIKVSKLIPYRDDVSFSEENIDQLSIAVTDNTDSKTYLLTSKGEGVYTGNDDFLPQTEHTYTLLFMYNNEEVTATTAIAADPQGVSFSASSITMPSFGSGGPGGSSSGVQNITVKWSNAAQDYYVLAVRCLNPDSLLLIDSGVVRTTADALLQDSTAMLSRMQFSYTGEHVVKLCRVQPEYVTLLQRNTQSSTGETLVEVNANVSGGFGIFTGVSFHEHKITVYNE